MSKFWTIILIVATLFVGTVIYKKNFNAKKRIVKTSVEKVIMDNATGIKYEILKEASPEAKALQKGETVVVHYTGWIDKNGNRGDRFDSSYDREKPFEFILGAGQVIKGWDEAVSKMKVGERRIVHIPAAMAYGQVGIPSVIPANADLIFDIEVVGSK